MAGLEDYISELLEEEGEGEPRHEGAPKQRPEFRVVQPDKDKEGKTVYKEVGAVWKHTSKAGKDFYVLNIGQLRLLMFPQK